MVDQLYILQEEGRGRFLHKNVNKLTALMKLQCLVCKPKARNAIDLNVVV